MKYKVIKEYERFYLCESRQGHKECFFKNEHKPDEDGFIFIKKEDNYTGGKTTPSENVNRSFNCERI